MVLFCAVLMIHVGYNSKSGSVYWFSAMAVLCCQQAIRDYMKSGGQFTQVKSTPSNGAAYSKLGVAETVKPAEWGNILIKLRLKRLLGLSFLFIFY